MTSGLQAKIDATANGIGYYFGGTLFEKYVLQGRFDDYRKFCQAWSGRHVEVSSGIIRRPTRRWRSRIGSWPTTTP